MSLLEDSNALMYINIRLFMDKKKNVMEFGGLFLIRCGVRVTEIPDGV